MTAAPHIAFDWLIVTASNESQAEGYRLQLQARRPQDNSGYALPGVRNVLVVPDPHNARAGSGGSTFAALFELARLLQSHTSHISSFRELLRNLRVLILHSGGDTQRLPEYSPSGKIFVPYSHPPLEPLLPGRPVPTTLFDCILHDFVRCAPASPCLMIGAGDLYLDLAANAAGALSGALPAGIVGISAAASPERGTRHGVYVADASNRVQIFLQKPSLEQLTSSNAIRADGTVAIDTGALFADWNTLSRWMSAAGLAHAASLSPGLLKDILDARTGSIDLYEHILPLIAPRSVAKPLNPALASRLQAVVADTPFSVLHIPHSKFLHIGTTRELLQVNLETPVAPSVSIQSFAARGPAFLENILAPDAVIEASGNNVLVGMPAAARAGRSLPADRCMAYFPIAEENWSLLWHPLNLDFKQLPTDPLATLRALLCAVSLALDALRLLDIDPTKAPFHWPLWPVGSIEQIESAYHDLTASSSPVALLKLKRLSIAELHKHTNLARMLAQQQAAAHDRAQSLPTLSPLPRLPAPTPRPFSSITVTAPARIDLAGGWTDTPPVCLIQGGHVVNTAITLNAIHPIRVTIRPTQTAGLTISSLDQQQQRTFAPNQPLELPPAHDWCSLAQAAALLTLCEDAPSRPLEHHLTPHPGLHVEFESRVPRGSGLGTSSILAGALIAAFRAAQGFEWSESELHQVCTRTLRAEQLIGAGGGWQDQYGGLAPGIKLLRTQPRDPFQAPTVTPLPLGPALRELFSSRALLYYTGQQRLAANILSRFISRYLNADPAIRDLCRQIADTADSVAQAIRVDNPDAFTHAVTHYWTLKRQIDPSATNPALESIITSIQPHLQGHLLPGAGGGGFLLFFARSDAAAAAIRAQLIDHPPNPQAAFFEVALDSRGLAIARD